MRAYVFRSAPESKHRAMQLACPKSANAEEHRRRVRTSISGDFEYSLEPQVRQPGVVSRAGTGRVPEVFPVGFLDRKVVDAGISVVHQAIGPEMPVLVPVRTEPVSGVIVPLVSEAHRDAVAGKGP
jgi:hypothetical protein